jgi:hypothetical protein
LTLFGAASYTAKSLHAIGQVAQLVERGPEKAGVGGSTPSLATISLNNLARLKTRVRISRVQYTYIYFSIFTLGVARSIDFQVSQPVLLALAMCCRTSLSSALSSLGTQDHLRVGEESWPIVICPLRTVDLSIEMNVVLPDQGVCLFDIRSLVNGEYQDHVPAEILGSQLRLHNKRRRKQYPVHTELPCGWIRDSSSP